MLVRLSPIEQKEFRVVLSGFGMFNIFLMIIQQYCDHHSVKIHGDSSLQAFKCFLFSRLNRVNYN